MALSRRPFKSLISSLLTRGCLTCYNESLQIKCLHNVSPKPTRHFPQVMTARFVSSQEPLDTGTVQYSRSGAPLSEADVRLIKAKYVTDRLKYDEFDLTDKVKVQVLCDSCNKPFSRLVSDAACSEGTVMVRCPQCASLHLVVDRMDWAASLDSNGCADEGFLSTHLESCKALRVDKDTVEVLPKTFPLKDEQGEMSELMLRLRDESLAENFSGIIQVLNSVNKCQVGDIKETKMAAYEYDVMRQRYVDMPDVVSESAWLSLLPMTFSKRRKYYRYMFKKEKARENRIEKKRRNREVNRIKRQELHEKAARGELVYGIGQNTIFRRLCGTYADQMFRWRMLSAFKLGPRIVFDLGYEHEMNSREIKNCADQLQQAYGWNQRREEPARVVFTGLEPTGQLDEALTKQGMTSENVFVDITNQHFNTFLPDEKFVILSPDAREFMPDHYDNETLYVISGIVDLGASKPHTLAASKKQKMRCMQLPFDKYVEWGASSGKSLPLDICFKILLTWMQTSDWEVAFKHIPRRKLWHEEEDSREKRLVRARRGSEFSELLNLNSR